MTNMKCEAPAARRAAGALWLMLLLLPAGLRAQCWQWVDPRIGSVGVGRTFPGPSMPFGMVKPGPDCGVLPNAGWAPMPADVSGFSQTHVSGTGGGQKYGNILLQPWLDQPGPQPRTAEDISLGYYAATYANGIRTEITTAARCAFYRFHYPRPQGRLTVDASHFLGKDSVPDLRERQQLVGCGLQAVSDREVRGFSRVRGGWNNGDAYTVYFALVADRPFTTDAAEGDPSACLLFSDSLVQVRVGISYVSSMQARRNMADTATFDGQLAALRQAWDRELGKVRIDGTDSQRRMFYTALYHTMLMPVDKTGENPRWTDTPYYDDYYAIWDTYRTSTPLLTLLAPQRQAQMVNSLLNIYRREGYMPDARSGDCNGRTQGGSCADVVIADAFVKRLPGIDYQLALEAMLKDGEADPGADHERHGRGGLSEYRQLGYVPFGIDRAGTRTVEYAYCDFCIAQVARGLGRPDIAAEYAERAHNWRNLWRKDYEWDGMTGFIMPRDRQGRWLDSVVWGRSKVFSPTIPYTPVTKVAPWYVPWWSTFFYEATSQEYSLSIPHDVEALVEACGGPEAFRLRLDRFFQQGYYNVQNEPSFLTPCLYHFIGRPDLSSQRIRQIVTEHYSDAPDGLPGNDDSGAMSSWLAFHMMGLYPNAGQDYYLLSAPLLRSYTLTLPNGRTLAMRCRGRGHGLGSVVFNGQPLPDARITHDRLMEGGEICYNLVPDSPAARPATATAAGASPHWQDVGGEAFEAVFTLNRQFRTWPLRMQWQGDTLAVQCKQTRYHLSRRTVETAEGFCWLSPQTDGTVCHDAPGTFCFISRQALRRLLSEGVFCYDGITWRRQAQTEKDITVRADIDGTVMRISLADALPLVLQMKGNPLGIDWEILRSL